MTESDETEALSHKRLVATRNNDKILASQSKSNIKSKVLTASSSNKFNNNIISRSRIPVRGFKSSSGNDIYNLTTPTTQKKMSVVSDRSSTSSTSNSTMETETESKHLSWDSGHNEEMSTTWYPDDDHNNINNNNNSNNSNNNNCSPTAGWVADDELHKDVKRLNIINSNEALNNQDTSDAKILSWHTLSIMTLQNMIIEQSEKMKQLEMNCHLQEILIKNQKDEIDLYQERVDRLEVQAKEEREDKHFIMERLETLENVVRYPRTDDDKLVAKINVLEEEVKVSRQDKLVLLEKVETLERVIDDHKEEMDMLLERIDDSMKTHGKEMDYLSDRADNIEELTTQTKVERSIYSQRLDNIEAIMKNLSNDAMELVSKRIDNLVLAFEQNKQEKETLLQRIEEEIELFLERVANLEVALHKAEKCSDSGCGGGGVIDRDHYPDYEGDISRAVVPQEAIADLHSKVVDTYTDTEAALNVIHNMLHKDKLTKII